MDAVKKWQKVGQAKILAVSNGRRLIDQAFKNPKNGQVLDFTLLDSDGITVIIFPLTIRVEVVAIRQFRHGAGEIILELPGGNADTEKESFIQAAHRELLEETGYKASKLMPLSNKVWLEPGIWTSHILPFLALGCEKTNKKKNDDNESTSTVVIPLTAWLDMISAGKISDMKTLAITSLAMPILSPRKERTK